MESTPTKEQLLKQQERLEKEKKILDLQHQQKSAELELEMLKLDLNDHQETPTDQQNQKICNKYNTPKGCPYGDKCKFLHQKNDQEQKRKICFKFNSAEGCTKGENCQFLHEKTDGQNDDKNKQEEHCRKFLYTPEGCSKGDKCKYLHDEKRKNQIQKNKERKKKEEEKKVHDQEELKLNEQVDKKVQDKNKINKNKPKKIVEEEKKHNEEEEDTNQKPKVKHNQNKNKHQKNKKEKEKKNDDQKVCEKFQSEQGCPFGDQCQYAHIKVDENKEDSKSNFDQASVNEDLQPQNLKSDIASSKASTTMSKMKHPCSYGYECKNKKNGCNLYHPRKCKFGFGCKNRETCRFYHLNKPKENSIKLCKYGNSCKNKDTTCNFTHRESQKQKSEDKPVQQPPQSNTSQNQAKKDLIGAQTIVKIQGVDIHGGDLNEYPAESLEKAHELANWSIKQRTTCAAYSSTSNTIWIKDMKQMNSKPENFKDEISWFVPGIQLDQELVETYGFDISQGDIANFYCKSIDEARNLAKQYVLNDKLCMSYCSQAKEVWVKGLSQLQNMKYILGKPSVRMFFRGQQINKTPDFV